MLLQLSWYKKQKKKRKRKKKTLENASKGITLFSFKREVLEVLDIYSQNIIRNLLLKFPQMLPFFLFPQLLELH